MESSSNTWQQPCDSVADLWEVEWTAFLPSWGRSAVPHYKWDSAPETNRGQWGQPAPSQGKQWTSWENKAKWENNSSKRWPQKNSTQDSVTWSTGLYVQDQGGVRGATGWELQNANFVPPGAGSVGRHSLEVAPVVGLHVESPGVLPSVGSAGHDQGLCKRCAFFPKGRCKNGADCTHCHMEHPKQVRHRKRAQNRGNRGSRHESLFEMPYDQVDALESGDEFFDDDDDALAEKEEFFASEENVSTPAPLNTTVYYLNNVLPTCDDMFWMNLYEQFQSANGPVVDEIGVDAKKVIGDFDCLTEAETACPSSSSDNEAKFYGVSSCDEKLVVQDVATSKKKVTLSHGTAQVEVSSTTETGPLALEPSSKIRRSKELTTSAGSWAAEQRQRRLERESTQDAPAISAEEIGRKAKSLLNKLTQEKFETLCQQILALPISTPEHLAAVVAEIFEKATMQRHFLMLYTELCARMDTHLAKEEMSGVGGKIFRKALVTECQACFERNLQQPFDSKFGTDMTYEERYELEVKHKTRRLGNMRFIGELLVRKLLAAKVFFFIVNEMLDIGNDAALESLAELLSIVAPTFEQKQSIYTAPLREVFAALKKKSRDQKVLTCTRCKLCDLLEARSRGWVHKEIADAKQ